jgi:hypothetical protein
MLGLGFQPVLGWLNSGGSYVSPLCIPQFIQRSNKVWWAYEVSVVFDGVWPGLTRYPLTDLWPFRQGRISFFWNTRFKFVAPPEKWGKKSDHWENGYTSRYRLPSGPIMRTHSEVLYFTLAMTRSMFEALRTILWMFKVPFRCAVWVQLNRWSCQTLPDYATFLISKTTLIPLTDFEFWPSHSSFEPYTCYINSWSDIGITMGLFTGRSGCIWRWVCPVVHIAVFQTSKSDSLSKLIL